MIRMPGQSFHEPLPLLSPEEITLRDELKADVQKLAGEIGERNLGRYDALTAAADFIEHALVDAGLTTQRQAYDVRGKRCANIEAEIRGATPDIFVVGAHYDSVGQCPGANDNGSGVAAMLALARRFSGTVSAKTLRFVAFPNEESGHFQSEEMGSLVYARSCKQKHEPITGMMSLETIGYFSNEPGSQKYPVAGLGSIYPTTGNFLAFVSNVSSRALTRRALATFRTHAQVPSEGAALPESVPGIGWSDHWSFWQVGYPAFMVTDTAPFRYPHYHEPTDTVDKLDYEMMARAVRALQKVTADLAGDQR
jgi:Zn-dependent M28 family amino/carboxypeptidase